MPRYRKHENADLPPRMHEKGGNYYLVTSNNGKRKWLPLGGNFSKALAAYHKHERGFHSDGKRMIDLYLRYRRHDFYLDLKPKTKDRYEYAFINILKVFRDIDVADIEPHEIWNYLDLRKDTPDAANTEHGILKKMFSLARLMGWRNDNPVDSIPYFKTKARKRILTAREFTAIYQRGNNTVQIGMELGYMLGIRVGDLIALTWGKLDENGLHVRQSKNDVEGCYEATDDLNAVLRKARGLHGRNILPTPDLTILHNRKMKPYTYYGFRAMFRRAVVKAGIDDVRFHDIRRTAITAAADEGRNPQDFSLHRSAKQAQDYVVRVPRVTPLNRM